MNKTVILPAALISALACCPCQPAALAQPAAPAVKVNPLRDAYYGDLHLHTSYSLDAYLDSTIKVDPDEAYRFAKGEVVDYLGQPVQRREPLDFLAVTDHSESIGVLRALDDPDSAVSRSDVGGKLRAFLAAATDSDGRRDLSRVSGDLGWWAEFTAVWRDYFGGWSDKLPADFRAESRAAWAREIDFANRNYEPGKFTTFIAYEWTSGPNGAHVHRNVIFKGDTAPDPFTSLDSKEPKALWDWLETIRKKGFEALAIPHNANASNGIMYDWIGGLKYIDRAYAEERQANEPLSEISQTKGTSEAHPLLSPNDEFADFEIYDFNAIDRHQEGRPEGSYLRDALSAGLVIQRRVGANPFKYGFVGGSDLHSGLSVSAQADYAGNIFSANMGSGKPSREQAARGLAGKAAELLEVTPKTTSGNLTGVWAESNTRDSIYGALRRRETFATTGTRLKFRFFAGWALPRDLLRRSDWVARAYAAGVPMGGDLPAKPADANAPIFAIWSVKDPNGANLDRAQIVKVWEENGRQRQKIYDVAWAGARDKDPKTGKLPAIGNTVDLGTGKYANTVGATELTTIWADPEFDPRHFCAYYLRILEIPTPRWSTLLAIEHGLPLANGVPATVQQRGWSSPIWYAARGPDAVPLETWP
jgi:hypothetical protein